MATIYDIAKASNSSTASVSRVLNGKPGVKAETAQRIRKAIEELEFQPRWKALERNRFLVLVPGYKNSLNNGYVSRLFGGISETSFRLGYNVLLQPFDQNTCTYENLRLLLAQEGAAGFIIISLGDTYMPPSDVNLTRLPHVVIGHKFQDDGVFQVMTEDYKAGKDAAEYLISLNHCEIAMVSFSLAAQTHHERYQGYRDALVQAKIEPRECLEFNDASQEAGKSAARRLLSPKDRPSAVIITDEDLAIGFQSEVKAMGLSYPQDISIIAFETTETLSLLDTPVTAMQTPSYAMGVQAVKALQSRITSTPKKPPSSTRDGRDHKMQIPLIVRHSTDAPYCLETHPGR